MASTSPIRHFRLNGVSYLLAAIFGVFLASIVYQSAPVQGCSKEVIVYENAECTENAIEDKDKIRNGTFGPDQHCNRCYCIKGKWKCEIKKCGCYPGAPVHVWMHNVRYGCFCTLEGILNLTDCTPEWFSIRKGRSVPSRLQYQLSDLHDP